MLILPRILYISRVFLEKSLVIAPVLFTNLLKPLTGFWRDKGINICVYLDNEAGTKKLYSKTFMNFRFVGNTLTEPGFVVKGIVNLLSCDS